MSAPTVTSQARTSPAKTEAELRRELAAVYRLLAHFKMTDLIFTHVSVRLPGPEHHFLINPYGLLFEEITASNLVKIGLDGELVEPSEYHVNPAGFVIHGAIHEARPDAQCVLHTHTKAGCAVAAQEHGLLPLNQISMEFYNRVGYHDYEGIALNTAERVRLVEDLRDHPAMILRNHGLLTVGASAAEAFLRMFYLEKACDIQIAAQASGELRVPSPEIAEHTARQFAGEATDDYTDDQAYEMAWAALLRMLDRTVPDYKD
ncbi:class II aldolase/adducin family protein [Rhodococcus opacus]|uniref:Class II aldolase/adducin family protein n=1 Tax=Rhodococcus opacus TaxID=37919 RepID=A0AAX3YHW4_RHOOP|nr:MULTISPECIES: class II aldolase/adducin family protein [Rhodococcus]ELB87920.1 aldolase II superfamily protein [Rhodococcus wratislaviensis IFP 2016]NHU45307.1 class II aldolase/adducin family protein [Rhodococcus sp. A14]MBA8958513.1 ribulose-5-phosphate 4-epimerase/fuculose-1-phosphate aldolase [Rhodococcus opacus]MBP2204078.1 ribulose-5-phosphate 4-epimerase/fuculose-1-phosphate aldolase [Rhodococcus opacus]MCZ4588029.1 class II aldolase/adducin family protein [Rhodococcus opacus]